MKFLLTVLFFIAYLNTFPQTSGYLLTTAGSFQGTITFSVANKTFTITDNFSTADFSLTSHVHTFASLSSKPTTLSGYGITDGLGSNDIGVTIQGFDTDLDTWKTISPGSGVGTWIATPSSANLANAITNETGSGALVFATSPQLVTPVIGAATGTSFAATGDITTTGGEVGYSTGAGGTVTQATNKTTAVTLNKQCGQITMNNAALAAAAEVAFTLTNSFISATDVVIVNVQSVGTAGSYFVTVGAVANGSCSITIGNVSTGSLSQAVVLNFCVIKGVNN